MENGKKIAVYCSASYTIDPEYNRVARDFVRAAVADGFTIVSGGTVKGTMGEIAAEIEACGGRHIGVLPNFMTELVYPSMTEVHWTATMAERKTLLREGTCAVVALPGGIGTLDEVIETYTLKKLGKYDGKVLALNHKGFYEPLKSLLDHYVREEMLESEIRDSFLFADTVEELIAFLKEA